MKASKWYDIKEELRTSGITENEIIVLEKHIDRIMRIFIPDLLDIDTDIRQIVIDIENSHTQPESMKDRLRDIRSALACFMNTWRE